jgi:ADP-heptose:LPS heptosyltransferase
VPALDGLPPSGRILVIRLRSLGDCVLTTPALELLRQARPQARIGVAVEPRFAGVFEGNAAVDDLLGPSAAAAARFRADLCLNLHGGTRSIALTLASRARLRAGFAHHYHAWAYNVRIPRAQEILRCHRKVHTAEHLASAMFHLGVPLSEIPRARLFAGPPPRSGAPYAVLHPLASAPEKTWPAARFAEAAAHIESRCGLEPVFIAGPGESLDAFRNWRCVEGAPLSDVKSLLAGASLFIGNDSGPAHMAAAFGLPVLVLFGASDPVAWAPWKTASETIEAAGGLAHVPASRVIEALERLRVAT